MTRRPCLPQPWQKFIAPLFDIENFYEELDEFIAGYDTILPGAERIFHVFDYMAPQQVRCVLYGEDPYPRATSACGVAFWDLEIKRWTDKTNGNSMKNILKALLTARGLASYKTPIAECRRIAEQAAFPEPYDLFKLWLSNGVLLINSAMTFTSPAEKKRHFQFWKPFHIALIAALENRETDAPHYILWGRKAQQWEEFIRGRDNIIRQGHPTFIHQFMDPDNPDWSPFKEIERRTALRWA